MERFAGKVAVVTGAGGGMGSAIVKELLVFNITVIGLDINIRKLKILEDNISTNLSSYTGKFFHKKCDTSRDEEVRNIFQWIQENLGPLSILINTAGIFIYQGQDVLNAEAETFDLTFSTNVKGTLLCSREAANCMMESSVPGHIINIGSIVGYDKQYVAYTTVYSASKHAVRVITEALKREISSRKANIKVTSLNPGVTRTEMTESPLFEEKRREEFLEPEDIAKACISILSTPHYVSISELIVEPLHDTLMDEESVDQLKHKM